MKTLVLAAAIVAAALLNAYALNRGWGLPPDGECEYTSELTPTTTES